MDGEFTCEDVFGTIKGVAGGNLIILARDGTSCLRAAELAVEAISRVRNVILPFPGGVVRSGSKVGSKYKALKASTNDAFAPTLRGRSAGDLPEGADCAYEIVIDGLDLTSVTRATAEAARAACIEGVIAISAGNYGGKLGPYHIKLRQALEEYR